MLKCIYAARLAALGGLTMNSIVYKDVEAGTIECVGYANGILSSDSFAPGVWAGIRDIPVLVKSKDGTEQTFNITWCDLQTRRLYHKIDENGPYFTVGDIVIIPEIRIEDGRQSK